MKKALIFLLISFSTLVQAQEIKQNNVYLEVAGASMFYSVNYERLWFKNSEHNMTTRLGLMYLYSFDARERAIRGIPLSISYIKKLKKNYFEVGLSMSVIRDSYIVKADNTSQLYYEDDLVLMPSFRIGLRHQPTDKKLFWNILAQGSLIAFGPIDDFQPAYQVFPFISFGIGYSF